MSDVQNYYDNVNRDYDQIRNKSRYLQRMGQAELKFVLNHVPEGGLVLEVGPGSGFFTQHLVSKARTVVAVDIAEEMLNAVRDRVQADNLNLHQLDVANLDELSEYGPFDSVVCMRVLPHITDIPNALQKIGGILRDGGNTVIDLWNQRSLIRLARKLTRSQQQVYTQYHRYDEMIEMIDSAHFQIADSWGWGYPGFDFIGYRIAKKYAHIVVFDLVKVAE